eukprot:357014-Chlamydomonas_euryale.AAC.3
MGKFSIPDVPHNMFYSARHDIAKAGAHSYFCAGARLGVAVIHGWRKANIQDWALLGSSHDILP